MFQSNLVWSRQFLPPWVETSKSLHKKKYCVWRPPAIDRTAGNQFWVKHHSQHLGTTFQPFEDSVVALGSAKKKKNLKKPSPALKIAEKIPFSTSITQVISLNSPSNATRCHAVWMRRRVIILWNIHRSNGWRHGNDLYMTISIHIHTYIYI